MPAYGRDRQKLLNAVLYVIAYEGTDKVLKEYLQEQVDGLEIGPETPTPKGVMREIDVIIGMMEPGDEQG